LKTKEGPPKHFCGVFGPGVKFKACTPEMARDMKEFYKLFLPDLQWAVFVVYPGVS
jgi:hypothetical protein